MGKTSIPLPLHKFTRGVCAALYGVYVKNLGFPVAFVLYAKGHIIRHSKLIFKQFFISEDSHFTTGTPVWLYSLFLMSTCVSFTCVLILKTPPLANWSNSPKYKPGLNQRKESLLQQGKPFFS